MSTGEVVRPGQSPAFQAVWRGRGRSVRRHCRRGARRQLTPKSPALERSSIAVAIGRVPPAPPFEGPPSPPRDASDGPTSGGTEADSRGDAIPSPSGCGPPDDRKATRISNEFRARKSRWTGERYKPRRRWARRAAQTPLQKEGRFSRDRGRVAAECLRVRPAGLAPAPHRLDGYQDAIRRARAALRAGITAGDTDNALAAFEAAQDAALALLREGSIDHERARRLPAPPACSSSRSMRAAPLTPHGVKDATSDPAVIEAWRRSGRIANSPGRVPADVVVVDVDDEAWQERLRDFKRLAGCDPHDVPTPQASTPSGGLQLFYTATKPYKNAVAIDGTGIDTRARAATSCCRCRATAASGCARSSAGWR